MSVPVGGPFHQIKGDTMELPMTSNGNKYVIPLVEQLHKWVKYFLSDNYTSESGAWDVDFG